MSDDNTTDGLPSSELYDLTAPNNEYITDIQTTISTETEFFTIKIHPSYDILELLSNAQKGGDQEKIKIEKNEEYNEYVISDRLTLKFSEFLDEFISRYFQASILKPLICKFSLFIFPNEDYKEPMIKIVYPDTIEFDNLGIRDDIEEKFKLFLVNNSESLEEFKAFRNIQKKFRFVIKRE